MVPVQGISLEYEKEKKKGAYEGKSGGEKKRKEGGREGQEVEVGKRKEKGKKDGKGGAWVKEKGEEQRRAKQSSSSTVVCTCSLSPEQAGSRRTARSLVPV